MVATRVRQDNGSAHDAELDLRRCVRDIVALSNLPAIWIKADPRQVANSLAQLAVSILDIDCALVVLGNQAIDITQCHDRSLDLKDIGAALRPEWRKPNARFVCECPDGSSIRGLSVSIGRDAGSALTALCRRPDFPTETEELLLRTAANQGAVTVQRWQTEQSLRSEIARRQELEKEQSILLSEVRESEHRIRQLLNAIPAAIYTTDLDGSVTMFNQAATDLAGRELKRGEDKWCVTWKLYRLDGTPLPHDECPMAVAVKERRPIRGVEVLAERPDGSRVPVMPFPTPLYDASGACIGAINMLIDISELKQARDAVVKRMEEQGALYRFTDSLYRAKEVKQFYEAALDAILNALKCNRASILLFDAEGIMRFVAWRGLSEKYRRAVEGHSPWTPDATDPEPLCIASVREAELDPSLKATVMEEGIAALSFVPIVVAGRLIGKFMTYYDSSHEFDQNDTHLAVTIARQLGFAIEQEGLRAAGRASELALRESESRKAVILESALDSILAMDQDGRIIDFNPAAERLFGFVREEVLGKRVAETIIPKRLRESHRHGLARFLQSGQGQVVGRQVEMRALRSDGTEFDAEMTVGVSKSDGANIRFIVCLRDVTERKRAEAQRELLLAELNHRVKNTLATVIAIGHQSFSKGNSHEEAWRSFDHRVRALAQTHSRLAESEWSSVSLRSIICDEVAPYESGGNQVLITGPELALKPKHAITLGMAIHELTTNAAKYGALSTKDGHLEVSWQIVPDERNVRLTWHESGGPLVASPSRSGFGMLLLERALATELQGSVRLDFAKQGLRCLISFPVENCNMKAVDGALPPSAVLSPESKAPQGNGSAHPETGSPRIMIVEDEFLLALELQDSLRAKSYVVLGPYHDLACAREAASKECIDVALLDTNLNGELVFPLAEELLAQGVACIFVTGYGASNLPERFRKVPRIGKPYSLDAIAIEIENVLANRRSASASPADIAGALASIRDLPERFF